MAPSGPFGGFILFLGNNIKVTFGQIWSDLFHFVVLYYSLENNIKRPFGQIRPIIHFYTFPWN